MHKPSKIGRQIGRSGKIGLGREVGTEDGAIKFIVTDAIIEEAVRNVLVFGPDGPDPGKLTFQQFGILFVGYLSATDGWPLVDSEGVEIIHSDLANELRATYVRNSAMYDADEITAEQFRAAVCPLFDRLTNTSRPIDGHARGIKGEDPSFAA